MGPEQGSGEETGAIEKSLEASRSSREAYLKEITPASREEMGSAAAELGLSDEAVGSLGVEVDRNVVEQKRDENEEMAKKAAEKADQVLGNLLKMASESKFGSNQYPSEPNFKEGILVEDPDVAALITARTHVLKLGQKPRPKIFNLGGKERYFQIQEQIVMNEDLRNPYTKERPKSWLVSVMDKPEKEYDPLNMSQEQLEEQARQERGQI